MKHWTEIKEGKIALNDEEDGRVVSLKMSEGRVRVREECDKYFQWEYSQQEAIDMLQEAIDFIKSNP